MVFKLYINDVKKNSLAPNDKLKMLMTPFFWFHPRNLNPKGYLPILSWLPQYKIGNWGIADLIAGITVGLTVIPQGIAYGTVAGLPPQYGLYSAFMGCFVYIFLGSSKDITVGPTAIMALMTKEYSIHGPQFAVLLTFLSGLIILLLGILRLGFIIDFISIPVIGGFTSAAAITIASTQIKGIFGLHIPSNQTSHSEGVLGVWTDIVNHMESLRWQDTSLGISCILVLLSLKFINNDKWFKDTETPWKIIFKKSLWLLSTSRNAIIVIVTSGIAYALDPIPDFDHPRNGTFLLTGQIPTGLPPFSLPAFSVNLNSNSTMNFPEMVSSLGSSLLIIPLIAILENIAIAKAFANGKPINANQEMIALGASNFFGSFVSSMPVTGSFSRTAVNYSSGVQTPLGGLFTGSLVLLCLSFLMPACQFIPKATLSAVIITAVIFSIECKLVIAIFRARTLDLLPAFVSFFGCLFWALEFGILAGVAVNILLLMYSIARPKVLITSKQISDKGHEYLYISPDRDLNFPSTSYVRNLINQASLEFPNLPVVLDCSYVHSIDFTMAEDFKAMMNDFHVRKQSIILFNVSDSVTRTLLGIKISELKYFNNEEELTSYLKVLDICG